MGFLQPEAEGSPTPVPETDTFERSVTSRPTISSRYINISIKGGLKSRKTKKYLLELGFLTTRLRKNQSIE